ncbi:hypothetical protein [Paraburkholderia kirstenboschensis]|uniref:Uncharacterized protein n=1 Tax=Paraburkholderia kirstenboschensis TaxID=1245436 RepID=A0ABZ0E9X7_9BURK|nr:hypothetical protein [Paraburkholderia kirstenboschensis]WOD14043.1 hypothetical protein RW095_00460 [Paraburkholderia kirstenboschensis]
MFNHFIQTFIDAQTAAWRHYTAIAATEKRLFGQSHDPPVPVPTTAQLVDVLWLTYKTLATRTIFMARDEFAVGAKRPLIHRAAIFNVASFDIERSLGLVEVPDFDQPAEQDSRGGIPDGVAR